MPRAGAIKDNKSEAVRPVIKGTLQNRTITYYLRGFGYASCFLKDTAHRTRFQVVRAVNTNTLDGRDA